MTTKGESKIKEITILKTAENYLAMTQRWLKKSDKNNSFILVTHIHRLNSFANHHSFSLFFLLFPRIFRVAYFRALPGRRASRVVFHLATGRQFVGRVELHF